MDDNSTMTMRVNARGSKLEVHTTIDTTDDDDRGNNTTIKRFTGEGGMVMVRSKEGCAVGRGGARRRSLAMYNPHPSIPT
jgi:hypothetical protein